MNYAVWCPGCRGFEPGGDSRNAQWHTYQGEPVLLASQSNGGSVGAPERPMVNGTVFGLSEWTYGATESGPLWALLAPAGSPQRPPDATPEGGFGSAYYRYIVNPLILEPILLKSVPLVIE